MRLQQTAKMAKAQPNTEGVHRGLSFVPSHANTFAHYELPYICADGEPLCSICLDANIAPESAGPPFAEWVALSCIGAHVFHAACLAKWGETSDTCPNCRGLCRLRTRDKTRSDYGPFLDPQHHHTIVAVTCGTSPRLGCAICRGQRGLEGIGEALRGDVP